MCTPARTPAMEKRPSMSVDAARSVPINRTEASRSGVESMLMTTPFSRLNDCAACEAGDTTRTSAITQKDDNQRQVVVPAKVVVM